jgi:hypothetical protein
MMFQFAHPRWELFSNNGMHNDMIGLHNNSIEAIHDDIHMLSGKGHSLNGVYVRAHMTDLAFAGKESIRESSTADQLRLHIYYFSV